MQGSYNRNYRRKLKKNLHLKDMKSTNEIAANIWEKQKEEKIKKIKQKLGQKTENTKRPLEEIEIENIQLDKDCPYSKEEVLEQIKNSDLTSLIKGEVKK